MESKGRFFQEPKQSFFLFGPRGTGKSTWLKEHFPNSTYIDLLSPENYRLFSARPERLQEMIEANPAQNSVIIDEIQKVPELLGSVHQLIEQNKQRKFVLTGSSARKLKRSGVDLLAGRAVVKTMHPFMAAELLDSFNLEKALQQGLVPLVVIGVLNSVVSIYYYLRVTVAMYMQEPKGEFTRTSGTLPAALALGIAVFLTLWWGVQAHGLLEQTQRSVLGLL